jgi:hypothetical protein
MIERGPGLDHLAETLLWAAYGLASIAVIRKGEICEGEIMDRAVALDPALFRTIYRDVLQNTRDEKVLTAAAARVEAALDAGGEGWFEPLIDYLRKSRQVTPLSEIADHFAHTQIYPGHLSGACEWLARRGTIQKVSASFRLTKKSRVELEEPAYLIDA